MELQKWKVFLHNCLGWDRVGRKEESRVYYRRSPQVCDIMLTRDMRLVRLES